MLRAVRPRGSRQNVLAVSRFPRRVHRSNTKIIRRPAGYVSVVASIWSAISSRRGRTLGLRLRIGIGIPARRASRGWET